MRNSFLIAIQMSVSLYACKTADPKIPIVVDKPIEVQLIEHLDEIISNEWKENSTETFSIDSVQGFVEYNRTDSSYRKIYLSLKTKEESLVNRLFSELKHDFDSKYGQRKCDDVFCTWKQQNSKSSWIEIMIMNESSEKKHPYLVIEIEEINE